jgi:hypothetical protein
MGLAYQFTKEKLLCGILYGNNDYLTKAITFLSNNFGTIDYQTPPMPFCFSSYYNDEMGANINRIFVSFSNLVDPSRLATIKLLSNNFEQSLATNGKRPVNLDPGLISTGRLALATTKNAGHRLALAEGIYAEITLFYGRKSFRALPWSYPDFKSEEVINHLLAIRKIYRANLKDEEQTTLTKPQIG